MDNDAILAELQPIFQDVLDQPGLVITRQSNAQTVEDWDSLAHVNIVTAVQKRFNIHFALSELQQLKDVGDMVNLIQAKLAAK